MPRSRHPKKASDEAIDASKRLKTIEELQFSTGLSEAWAEPGVEAHNR